MSLSKRIIDWLRDWFPNNGRRTAVLGISGGKDSAVVAGLCKEALGGRQVFGVMMPNGTQKDISDSERVVQELGIRYGTANIEKAYQAIVQCVYDALGMGVSEGAAINIAPRIRMTILYAVAQTLSEREGAGACVVGTGNRAEAEVGYTTKSGDSACDVNPIRDLWVDEVIQAGDEMGYFPEIVHKRPDDGLCGKSDEEKLGFTYEEVKQLFIGGQVDELHAEKIRRCHELSRHKREPIPYFQK